MMLWDITRASAFVAFGCYTVVVAWGVLLAGKGFRPAGPQAGFHRFLSSLGLLGVITHVTSAMLDKYAKLHAAALFGGQASSGVRLGVAAVWLAVALPLSLRLRTAKVISMRTWRRLHYSGYAAWALMLAHGIATGTTSGSPWAVAFYAATAGIVGGAGWWRWMERPQPAREGAR